MLSGSPRERRPSHRHLAVAAASCRSAAGSPPQGCRPASRRSRGCGILPQCSWFTTSRLPTCQPQIPWLRHPAAVQLVHHLEIADVPAADPVAAASCRSAAGSPPQGRRRASRRSRGCGILPQCSWFTTSRLPTCQPQIPWLRHPAAVQLVHHVRVVRVSVADQAPPAATLGPRKNIAPYIPPHPGLCHARRDRSHRPWFPHRLAA